ncbi:hypothetical protein SAMN03080594_108170 [Arenibacter palladensis]|uniref:Uncharacterized protein n=1 Tax=Arenibacter palladensis TaxID=237373 RepID=A0A1M5F6I8_9FLAO|nr:hypothetical protein SAMN03080594_108170 [Arenibacter palladensis]
MLFSTIKIQIIPLFNNFSLFIQKLEHFTALHRFVPNKMLYN